LDHNELGTDEVNEFAVRYLEDTDEDRDESADDDELYESEDEPPGPWLGARNRGLGVGIQAG
jgi:hypothetical protein